MTEQTTTENQTTEPVVAAATERAETAAPEGDSFLREHVEQLRRESAGCRERAHAADQLATRLHTALVVATGRLADPTDLPFDPAHLDDASALASAVDDLLARKPHLAARRVTGDVGAGTRGPAAEPVSLLGIARTRI